MIQCRGVLIYSISGLHLSRCGNPWSNISFHKWLIKIIIVRTYTYPGIRKTIIFSAFPAKKRYFTKDSQLTKPGDSDFCIFRRLLTSEALMYTAILINSFDHHKDRWIHVLRAWRTTQAGISTSQGRVARPEGWPTSAVRRCPCVVHVSVVDDWALHWPGRYS